jgi:hypothetical protein
MDGSVSKETDYKLKDRFSILDKGRNFSLRRKVQTESGCTQLHVALSVDKAAER